MKWCLPLTLLLLSLPAGAQDCDPAALAKKAGTWKAGLKGSTPNVSPADLVHEKAYLSAIHQRISTQYQPTGCQVLYSQAFSGYQAGSAKNWVADNYQYTLFVLRYLCDKQSPDPSKFYVDAATPTTVSITANAIRANDLYAAELADDDLRGYLKLKAKPQLQDGFYFMGEEVVADGHLANKVKEYRWLITYPEQLPFVYVTRKEYLLIQQRRLEKTIREQGGNAGFYDPYVKRIQDHLQMPEAELSAPAICLWNDEERFNGFVAEGTSGSFVAIKPNPAYYNKKLPRSAPQFFSVVYKLSHGDPVFEANMAAIQRAVDFSALRAMLGKGPDKAVGVK